MRSPTVLITLALLALFPASAPAAFTVSSTIPTGDFPGATVAGDFNNDGRADLAVANVDSSRVSILLGNGDGSFAPKRDQFWPHKPLRLAVGDFNNDGNQDLVASPFAQARVAVALGSGDGTLSTPVIFGGYQYYSGVAVADFNNDGNQDYVVSYSYGTDSGRVAVLRGQGNGNFVGAEPVPVSAGQGRPTVGEFTNDGRLDVALTHISANTATFLRGDGSGGLTPIGSPKSGGNTPMGMAVGDLDGDANQDLVAANGGGRSLWVLSGQGNGAFETRGSPDVDLPDFVALGDFNRDARQDTISSSTAGDTVSVALGQGNMTFAAATSTAVPDNPTDIAIADFNGDGNQDAAVTAQAADGVTVLLSTDPAPGNLIVNGDAEGAGAGATLTADPVPPGWTREQGRFTFARYGSPGGFVPSLFAAPLRGGLSHFAGGPATTGPGKSDSAASQTVDVSGNSAAIDQGRATANLSAMLGGFQTDADRAHVTATFLDEPGTELGVPLQLGPVTAADRHSVSGLLPRAASGPVPAGTRRIRVRIQTTFECCSYNDGYADNVALTLAGEGVPPAPPPPDDAPPAGDPLALSKLAVKPSKFRAASKGGAVAAAATKKAPVGGTVSFSLSRAAPVKFTIARPERGVVKGKKCVAPPRKPTTGKKPKACTRYVKVVSFSRASALGTNTFRLTGRISKRRALSAGRYRLTAVGQPPGGAPTPAASRTFTIVR